MDKIFAKVENYMNITQHKANAKKKLTTIAMRQDKTVSEFYYQIFDLQTIAGMQSENQIKMFQILLSLWICNQLSIKRYTDFNILLHDARLVEGMKKENTTCFPYWDKPMYNWSSGSGYIAPISTSASENARDNGIIDGFSGRQGSYSNLVAMKPAGWTGQWHEPQTNFLKLTNTDCKMLLKQGYC